MLSQATTPLRWGQGSWGLGENAGWTPGIFMPSWIYLRSCQEAHQETGVLSGGGQMPVLTSWKPSFYSLEVAYLRLCLHGRNTKSDQFLMTSVEHLDLLMAEDGNLLDTLQHTLHSDRMACQGNSKLTPQRSRWGGRKGSSR